MPPESALLARLKGVDPLSFWQLSTLDAAILSEHLGVQLHTDGTLSVHCTVCHELDVWGEDEWAPDAIPVHHTAQCLLMTPKAAFAQGIH